MVTTQCTFQTALGLQIMHELGNDTESDSAIEIGVCCTFYFLLINYLPFATGGVIANK